MLQKQFPSILAIAIFISYFQLFAISAIPGFVRVGVHFVAPFVVLGFVILKVIYKPESNLQMRYFVPLLILIISSLVSFIPAKFVHQQSLMQSFMANKLIYYYFLFFFLHEFKVDAKLMEKVIIGIGILTIAFYYIQLFVYPVEIFDIVIFEDRNTLRMFFPTLMCTHVAYFYFLNKAFREKTWAYLIVCLLVLSVLFIQATRQVLFSFVLLTIIYVLKSREVRNKLLVFLLIAGLIFSAVIIFEEIIRDVLELTFKQAATASDNVRVRAVEYYLTSGTPGFLAYLFGNGPPANASSYGAFILSRNVHYGLYLSDIGVIGDYYKYGLFFIFAIILIYYLALKHEVQGTHTYWKYYVLYTLLIMFTGRGQIGNANILLIVGFYLMDVNSVSKQKIKHRLDS